MPSSVRHLVSVVCGNDIYKSRFAEGVELAVKDYCDAVRDRGLGHFAVVGMPAAIKTNASLTIASS